jgi:PAS domain S-box-containing protein
MAKARTSNSKKESVSKKAILKDLVSGDFLESVLDAITDGITVINRDLSIDYINQSLAHFYGYESTNEVLGMKCHKAFREKKTQCAHCPTDEIFQSGKPHHALHSSFDAHGNEIFWDIYFYPIYDEEGDVARVVEYSRNITKEKVLESQIQESERKIAEILSVSRDLIAEVDLNLKCNFISDNVEDFTGYTREEMLKADSLMEFATPESQETVARYVKARIQGKPAPTLYEIDMIHKDGSIIPVEVSIQLLKEEGKMTGSVVTVRNIVERKATQEALKESEKLYRTLVEMSPDGIVLTDMDTNIIMTNTNGAKNMGYKPEEVVGMSAFDLMAPEDQPRILEYVNDIIETGKVENAEFNFMHKDGVTRIPIEFNAALVYDGKGEPEAFMGIARNIEERKKIQEQTRQANERLQYLLSTTSAIIYTAKAEGDFGATFVSENILQMTGFKASNFIKKENFWMDHIHPDDRSEVSTAISSLFNEDSFAYNYRFKCKSGKYIWVRDEMKLARDSEGKPLEIVGFWMDINDQVEAEYALKESEEKYSNLFQNSNDAIIIHDPKGKIMDANKRALKLFGFSKKELLKKKVLNLHPKNDLAKSKKAFKSIEKKGFVQFEINFINKKGETFPTEVSSSLFEIGNRKVIQGIIRDIKERKKAEEALRESEEMYRSLIETSPDAITVTDLEGKITYVSQRAVEFTGFTKPEELIGRNAFEFIAPEDQEIAAKNLQNTLETGYLRNTEYTMLKKDGTKYIGELNAAVIKDAHGNPRAFIGNTRDVTERKKAEEALRYRLQFEEIITTFSTHFINLRTEEIDVAINLALKEIGEFADVDRSYVLLLRDHGSKINNAYEWCAEGISSKKELFDGFPTSSLKWGFDRLKKLFPLDIPNVNALPKEASKEKKLLKKADIKSVVAVPIVISGALYGVLGFDCVTERTKWSDDTISILRVVSDILANALERKRVEEAARESEEKFRSLAEKSPSMIFINQMGEIVYANEACEEIMGYTRAELYSPDFNFMTLIAPESINMVKRSFEKHKKGAEVHPFEYTLLKKDGTRLETIIATKLISFEGKPAILGIITDISERKKAEEEIKELKDFSESIVESMAEGIMILDTDGFVTFINPKIEEVLGYSSTELVGTHWDNILPADYHRKMRDTFSENKMGRQDRFEGVLLKKNKTEFPALISASPQMKDDRFEGVLIVITDISDRKKEHFAREELMKYKIKRGTSYLIEEKKLERSKDVVTELYKNHFDGIIITREHPEKIRTETKLNLPIFWMTNDPKDKSSVKPQFSLLEKIIDDNIDRNTFVFLDRFDYIVTQNSFMEALNFVQHLNEIFYARKSILVISLDPDTLSTQELSLLEKETSVIEKKEKERLSADLIDLLEYVNRFNRIGESPSYSQVTEEFKITRTTARKRIKELVLKGLISEKKSGRFKFLVITESGKESL